MSFRRWLLVSCYIGMGFSTLFSQAYPDRHSTNLTDGWLSCNATTNPNPVRGGGHWIMYNLEIRMHLPLLKSGILIRRKELTHTTIRAGVFLLWAVAWKMACRKLWLISLWMAQFGRSGVDLPSLKHQAHHFMKECMVRILVENWLDTFWLQVLPIMGDHVMVSAK